MLEVFTKNESVAANTAIPLEQIALIKNNSAILNGSTITLNRCGVYRVSVNASAYATTGTLTSIQLMKDNILVPQAYSEVGDAAATTPTNPTPNNLSFSTLVQVSGNNTPCPCSSGTNLTIISGTEATFTHLEVNVTKIA